MTKTNVALKTETKNELVDASFFDSVSSLDGAGAENVTFADRKTPIYSLVEPLSKALSKNNEKFIAGAESGDIIDTSVRTIVGKSFDFIPVKFVKEWLEWSKERGLAPVRHRDASIMQQTQPKYENERLKGHFLPNGNEVQETSIFYGIDTTNGNWAVLPLAKGRLGAARDWVEKLARIKNPVSGKQAAYFIQVWEVSSKATQSKSGEDYSTYGAAFKCFVNEYEGGMEAFEQAKDLAEALAKDDVKTDFESFASDKGGATTEDLAAF